MSSIGLRYLTTVFAFALACACLPGCVGTKPMHVRANDAGERLALARGLDPAAAPDAFVSTYRSSASEPIALVGATLFTGTGARIDNGNVLMRDGRIEAVGADIDVPSSYRSLDMHGKWITPGLIDVHSHLGGAPSPSVAITDDVNEVSAPVTPEVWVEHSVWPQDPGFDAARAGGVTTLQILPGSANLFGGRSVTLKNVHASTVQQMKFPGAPYGLKMACGENPKRFHGDKGRAPSTRMGEVAEYRKRWIDAAHYAREWDIYRANALTDVNAKPPKRDLQLDTLAGVLRGELIVHNHCYRADEMAVMLDVAREFGYRVGTFHHAVEAYKITDLLVANDVCVATWAGWWGYKLEVYDGIEANAAAVHAAGGCAILHSDDGIVIQHLNIEAATALAAGRSAGLDISEAEAMTWITANPAKALGILDRTGTLEVGKMADVVVWDRDPFSVYAVPQVVYIDGVVVHEAGTRAEMQTSDFLLGQGDRR